MANVLTNHRDDPEKPMLRQIPPCCTFYTSSGREVIEGRGVIPDVEVPAELMSYVLEGLLEQGVLFDFVVAHRNTLSASEDAEQFSAHPNVGTIRRIH